MGSGCPARVMSASGVVPVQDMLTITVRSSRSKLNRVGANWLSRAASVLLARGELVLL
jgi:hypothetical protein